MAFPNDGIRRFLTEGRFLWLLVSLVFMLAVAPLFDDDILGSVIMLIGLTAVFATGVFANQHRRRMVMVGGVVAVLALPIMWATMITQAQELSWAFFSLAIVFCSVTATLILTAVVRDRAATLDAIFGATCVYLLMGLTWALAYSAVEYHNPESALLKNQEIETTDEGHLPFSDIVYFSFVTMSTLGYGDIVPGIPSVRTLAWMQSVAGQFYLAVLVARLINVLPESSGRSEQPQSA